METVSDWDTAEFIETREDALAYLEAVIAENDVQFLLKAIGNVARSKAMAGMEALYQSLLREGNPSFITVMKVLDNLGFRLNIIQKKAS
ncbi:putative addiction module antidote protein [Spirochaetia bacterium]|nr:putative addiction module antidote protein [Spirochaetia bacterium]